MRRSYPMNAIAIRTSITISTTRCSFFDRSKIRKKRFIFVVARFGTGFVSLRCIRPSLYVMLSGAKHLWPPASSAPRQMRRSEILRFAQNDKSIAFHFFA
jgi:hypothetical protein